MRRLKYALQDFIRQAIENNYGLASCTVIAFFVANSNWQFNYVNLQHQLHFFVNDICMSLFFFLIGMELKREWVIGELQHPQSRTLPAVAALGGMIFPAIIYLLFNYHDPITRNAAAIPMATDIAFALGALQLLGNRIAAAEKIFLLSLAVFDDIGAIIIIALFYSKSLWPMAFTLSAVCLFLFCYYKKRQTPVIFYLLTGFALWISFWKAGIHPTLSGVITGLFMPFNTSEQKNTFFSMEKNLHTVVSLFVLPLFAFINAGFVWTGLDEFQTHLPLISGILLGLFVGKPLGIVCAVFLYLAFAKKSLPPSLSWPKIIGIGFLAGIGFTMSLFIGTLSFESARVFLDSTRMAILLGSLFSALMGILFLLMITKPRH